MHLVQTEISNWSRHMVWQKEGEQSGILAMHSVWRTFREARTDSLSGNTSVLLELAATKPVSMANSSQARCACPI
jgi:hypothetical protein